jgi:hypothetical protein
MKIINFSVKKQQPSFKHTFPPFSIYENLNELLYLVEVLALNPRFFIKTLQYLSTKLNLLTKRDWEDRERSMSGALKTRVTNKKSL